MRLTGTIARLAGVAAAGYAGYAAFTWLRYGRPKKVQPTTALDRFMPDAEIIDRHCIGVNAPTDITYETCCAFDVAGSRVAQVLFDTRAYALGSKPYHPDLPPHLVEQMKALGWVVLEETPGHEIVFGIASKPWLADGGFRALSASEFATFHEPGWVKIIFNFTVESAARCCSLLATETRAIATDGESRRRFRGYWSLVAPGVKLIRRTALHAIKTKAESTVQNALRSAAHAA
jgi:hypothetical protein